MGFTEEEIKILKENFYIKRISLKNIAKILNCSETKVRNYIKKNNMTRDPIRNAFKDETGKKFGYLTVLKLLDEKNSDNRRLFLCQCKCGNLIKVPGKRLRSGNTKSCGCLRKEKALEILKEYAPNKESIGLDLTGKRYGKLTVLKEVDSIVKSNGKNMRRWLCKCDCGNEIIVQHTYLTTGDTVSCGCLNSKGERIIENILKENNIPFKKQYSFKELKNKLPLHFDFGILDSNGEIEYLIEFDGEQHYDKNNNMYSEERARLDIKKNIYCLSNNIPLIRIPYNFLDKININMLKLNTEESKKFLVNKEDFYDTKIKL